MSDDETMEAAVEQPAPAPLPAAAAPNPPTQPSETPMELEEFCTHHSKPEHSRQYGIGRIELLNAFYVIEKHAGRTRATEVDFVARLREFATKPAV